MIDLKTFLHGLPAFERFNDRQLDVLVSQLHVETHEPGTVLIRQGEQGSALYIVVSGAIRVSQKSADVSEENSVHEAHAGEMVGRMSLVPDLPSPVTCTAAGQITVASLTFDRYHALFILAPRVAHQFQYMVASQLAHYLMQKNQSLAKRHAPPARRSLLERLFGA